MRVRTGTTLLLPPRRSWRARDEHHEHRPGGDRGQALPDDIVPLLTSAYIDDSQRLPDMFSLRFRDPARIVLSKTNAKIGAKVKISVMTADAQTPNR